MWCPIEVCRGMGYVLVWFPMKGVYVFMWCPIGEHRIVCMVSCEGQWGYVLAWSPIEVWGYFSCKVWGYGVLYICYGGGGGGKGTMLACSPIWVIKGICACLYYVVLIHFHSLITLSCYAQNSILYRSLFLHTNFLSCTLILRTLMHLPSSLITSMKNHPHISTSTY